MCKCNSHHYCRHFFLACCSFIFFYSYLFILIHKTVAFVCSSRTLTRNPIADLNLSELKNHTIREQKSALNFELEYEYEKKDEERTNLCLDILFGFR